MHRRITSTLAATFATVALLLTACGGDDGGPGGSSSATLTDAEFCARLEELEAQSETMSEEDADAAFFEAIGPLVASAPNPEIAAALSAIAGMVERLEGLDDDDPEAFGEAFAIMFDPEFLASAEYLETYLTETCGFTETGLDDLGDLGDGSDDWSRGSDLDYDEDAYEALSDDLSSLRAALEPVVAGEFGYGLMRFMGAPSISVDIDLADNPDPVAVCEAVGAIVDGLLAADGLEVQINERSDFNVVASRPPGGTCAAD